MANQESNTPTSVRNENQIPETYSPQGFPLTLFSNLSTLMMPAIPSINNLTPINRTPQTPLSNHDLQTMSLQIQ